LSAWARSACTAGPLPVFSIRIWMKVRSIQRPISPPSASISRTRWPLAGPPIDGLQGISATWSSFIVSNRVRQPSRAAASAASHPAWPAPTTTTSTAAGNAGPWSAMRPSPAPPGIRKAVRLVTERPVDRTISLARYGACTTSVPRISTGWTSQMKV
jgi:hypothetical protein